MASNREWFLVIDVRNYRSGGGVDAVAKPVLAVPRSGRAPNSDLLVVRDASNSPLDREQGRCAGTR